MADSDRAEVRELHRFQRQIARKAFGASVVVGLLLFGVGYKPVARGLLLGALFSVLNFVIMAHALPRQLGFERRKATVFALVSILLRFGLLALPLFIGLKFESFHWIAVVVGLFTVPLAILADQVIVQRFFPNKVHP